MVRYPTEINARSMMNWPRGGAEESELWKKETFKTIGEEQTTKYNTNAKTFSGSGIQIVRGDMMIRREFQQSLGGENQSKKMQQVFLEVEGRQELRILLHHLEHRAGFLRLETVVRVMHEVASGPKLAVLVLVVIPAHLLPQDGLVLHQLLHPVREETVVAVRAVPSFRVALAQFQLALEPRVGSSFIIYHLHTHHRQLSIIHNFISIPIFTNPATLSAVSDPPVPLPYFCNLFQPHAYTTVTNY